MSCLQSFFGCLNADLAVGSPKKKLTVDTTTRPSFQSPLLQPLAPKSNSSLLQIQPTFSPLSSEGSPPCEKGQQDALMDDDLEIMTKVLENRPTLGVNDSILDSDGILGAEKMRPGGSDDVLPSDENKENASINSLLTAVPSSGIQGAKEGSLKLAVEEPLEEATDSTKESFGRVLRSRVVQRFPSMKAVDENTTAPRRVLRPRVAHRSRLAIGDSVTCTVRGTFHQGKIVGKGKLGVWKVALFVDGSMTDVIVRKRNKSLELVVSE